MKNFYLIILLFVTTAALGQDRGQFYKVYSDMKLHHIEPPVSPATSPVVRKDITVPVRVRSREITPANGKKYRPRFYKANLSQKEKNGDTLRVSFWSIPASYDNQTTANNVKSGDTDNYYSILEARKTLADVPSKYQIMYYERNEIGVATMPFRFRPGYRTDTLGKEAIVPNDVSAAVNVGLYIGHKWGETLFYNDPKKTHDRWGVMVSAFTGPTLISVATTNVSKKVSKATNEPGWQLGGGVWITNRNIEVGVFVGTDIPLSGAAKKWDYAYKPWLGFGLGYKLDILNLKKQ